MEVKNGEEGDIESEKKLEEAVQAVKEEKEREAVAHAEMQKQLEEKIQELEKK